jgi:integrase
MVLGYVNFADGYYRKAGKPTGEVVNIKHALKHLKKAYGSAVAREFGPLSLKAVRDEIIATGVCRGEVNRRVRHIVRAFKWAVENELVAPSVHQGLKAVAGLRKGRSEARESKPVRPVPELFVDALEPHVSRQVWKMIELQRLTAMRPGEVCQMRTCDLDTSGKVWIFTPESHKTEHHGRGRQIYLGPAAQMVLRPWLRTELEAYLFQPREAMGEKWEERRQGRRTPMTPSQQKRKPKRNPKKAPGERYDTWAYYHAIRTGCAKAFPHPDYAELRASATTKELRAKLKEWCREHHDELRQWGREHSWHPNQLRHNAATRLRKEFGLDVARVILGHSSPVVTEVYAEVDRATAMAVIAKIG